MIKINSFGNEQIEDALLEDAIDKIKESIAKKDSVFIVYGTETMFYGNTLDVLAKVGVGLERIFSELEERHGTYAANSCCASFVSALSKIRQENSRG